MSTLPALHTGDLVEVLADDPKHEFYYGEVTHTTPITVNYITKVKGDVWRFDDEAYQVDRECINHVVDMSKCKKTEGWREMGFVYRGEHEIIHEDDVDSEEEDEDYQPSGSDGEASSEGSDSEEEACESGDEPVEKDADFDDDLTDTDGETDVPTTDDEEDAQPSKRKAKRPRKN